MVLSVLNPGAAMDKAREVAAAARATGRGALINAGIVGAPPRGNAKARTYVAGPDAHLFTQLTAYAFRRDTATAGRG